MRNTLKLTREIVRQSGFDEFRGREISPLDEIRTDQEIDAFVRKFARSAYHPIGTCRMGSDERSVCTPDLKVRGVDGLRVVDASVFPFQTSGTINAPTVMVAERGADLIAGVPLLRPENLPFYNGPGRVVPTTG
jgi:choline dehydrogenase